MRILVTGHKGFIGRNFFATAYGHEYIGFDKKDGQDLCGDISGLLENIDVVVNFAAKTFVDHSIKDPSCFFRNNIQGTFNLLEEARRYPVKKFIHISTDEVYGSIGEGEHLETSILNPGNPYSATKAACDMLCLSYFNTYKIPIVIVRPENNYGFFQDQQKLIPNVIRRILSGQPVIVYGDGLHKRMWLRVEDMCSAIHSIIAVGKPGEIYNIGGNEERTNIEIVRNIYTLLGEKENIEFIPDDKARPGHDRRYAMNTEKIRSLGWHPIHSLHSLKEVVEHYVGIYGR